MGEDLYEHRNSNYCYPNSDVLINKLNIRNNKTLQKYEAKITAAKLLALRQKGIIGNFDVKPVKDIHLYLFILNYLLYLINFVYFAVKVYHILQVILDVL